jgi:hypothetical protein
LTVGKGEEKRRKAKAGVKVAAFLISVTKRD